MKKLLTFSLMAVASLAMSAETVNLWTGSCSFANWNPIEGNERPVLTTSELSEAQIGDKLVLTISTYGDESWRQAQIYTWNGEGTGSEVASSPAITSGMTSVEFTFDQTLIDTVNETDICIVGTGYTVTQIDLTTYDGVIWQGECVCANWDATPAVNLAGSNFAMAKEGDQLIFYVEIINKGEWSAIQINTANWQEGPFGVNEIADDQTEVKFMLNPQLLTSLTQDGIDITGANFKLTKIALVSEGTSAVSKVDDDLNVNAPVYNIQGVKVADSIKDITTPGIYISGGKKYIVK